MEKHLHYYTQHSQYSEPTDKPAVSYCKQEDEVHYAAVGSVTLITFNINSKSYQAEEGMTWEDWVNSSYNTDEFVVENDNSIVDKTHDQMVIDSNSNVVYATTAIVAGYNYTTQTSGYNE